MKTELLLHQTRLHFPRFDVDEIKITPIEKGGSDRKFYRVRCSSEQSLILVKYNRDREENRHYVEIAQFLEEHEIRAPRIYYHAADEGLIWLEDLGESDLFSYRSESWLVRRAFYESALDEVRKLHQLPESVCIEMHQHLPAEFNAALYLWEQTYFFENCLGRYFKIDQAAVDNFAGSPVLRQIAEDLAQRQRVLVHRDFQSQNILMRNGHAYLIDFQGMRPGLAQYDLASLLYDPYVDLTGPERNELLEHYCGQKPDADFLETLRLCAMQRLMQALGAYGFLGLVKGHKQFLQYIPKAVNSLCEVVARIDGLELFGNLLSGLH
ncbi:MAG TPA: aminoglycoside phosphotransferase family protein [Chthoniobacterales bacterium]|jgi:aminoglycoside/choline kinase family phosphotransferase|nr:aminoglycoside phosphotransferase family protein [Chthoniobacterales bacterium]